MAAHTDPSGDPRVLYSSGVPAQVSGPQPIG